MSFLKAEWRKLIMANYEIEPAILQPLLPAFTTLDFFEGKTYVSLVGFLFDKVRLKGIRIPFHTRFPEVNLRFYVRYRQGNHWKRGTVFVSEIVPKPAISFVANTLYNEHYSTMPMRYSWLQKEGCWHIDYKWKYKNDWQHISVVADEEKMDIPAGHFNEFITEHYWGYNKINLNKTTEYEVRHPRWQEYLVKEYSITTNFEKLYGPSFGFLNNAKPANVLLAKGSAISIQQKKLVY